jgi:hypothetical protein
MLQFFIGFDYPAIAWPFLRSMISTNTIRDRSGKTMAILSPLSHRISCVNLSLYTRPASPSKIAKKSQSISQTFTSCPFSRAILPDLTPHTLIATANF